jgi:inosine-uridine nucleoside N-ribohydrolase
MKKQTRHKAILDTDPGVDDAMALYYALAHPDLDIVGITTTFGNVSVEQAARNALYLCEIAGRNIPVAKGIKTPMTRPQGTPPDFIHGADGLGNLTVRARTTQQLDPRPAAQYIVDMARAHPSEITLVAVGPLGNLAAALMLEPQLPELLREVVVMGGTILEPGNVSPVAEANIWNDPHAADRVFSAGWKLTMVGLDVTHQVILSVALFKQIAAHHKHLATDTLYHAVHFYSDFYSGLFPHVAEIHGCFGHDVLAFIYLTNPELFTTQSGQIRVATEGLAQGQTMMNRKDFIAYPQAGWVDVPLTRVCMQVQAEIVVRLYEDTLMRPWLQPA